ncbi:MAG TPA: acyl-CoA dehydrogenase family protein [Acidimicrobiales bacterium]|jgi:alkylation response protein AidB-like acyl-CoA dehydrogenase|nr:acyl-CoA dehydrogenase family protein [Acidimicrobiales bacterium]
MDFALTPDDEAFRDELRGWLDDHLPPFLEQGEIGEPGETGADGPQGERDGLARTMDRRRAWQQLLHEGRWAAINWPEEWGGRDATIMQNVVYSEEMARARTPAIFNANGIWQIGPMIIRWGTEEQKQRWLPGILDAGEHWCQGFTEPEAGSDLANLRTLAVADGDEYVLNGTKVWISTAQLADWGLFLVRTDPSAIAEGRKHEGITALIVPMDAPGIECRPIREITGDAMFCEVVFSDARVPVAHRLGGEGEGWAVAMGTLTSERVGSAGISIGLRYELEELVSAARKHNPAALADPDIRDRVARAHSQIEFTRLLNARALSKVLKGEKGWPEVPLAKLQWSHLSQFLAELGVDILGPAGVLAKGGPDAVDGGHWTHQYPWQRFTSIGAGATEVQKNIIADRAIKLPKR